MILVIIGVILGILAYVLDDRVKSYTTTNIMFLAGSALVLLGLLMPFAGYEEPVLAETKPLYSINHVLKDENIGDDIYVMVNYPTIWKDDSYTYCVEKNGKFGKESRYESTKLSLEDIDTPVIEMYEKRPTKTLFSLNILGAERYWIIRIPKEMVEVKYPIEI